MTSEQFEAEVKNLEYSNFLHVHGVAHQIHKELNLTKKDTVSIDRYSTYSDIWRAEGVKSLTSSKTSQIKIRILVYLKEIGVTHSTTYLSNSIVITVHRKEFYNYYEALRKRQLNSLLADHKLKQAKAAPLPAPPSALPVKASVYEIKFNDGVILLNNMYMSKPQFGSINYDFFEYIFKKPNERHDVKDLMSQLNHTAKKTVHHILNDLGFKGDLKALFFPRASSRFIEFVNPVTAEHLKSQRIDYLKVEIGRNSVEKRKN